MDWITTFEALNNIYSNSAYSNMAINDALKNHKDSNASFVRMFVKGVLRESIKIDYYINKLAFRGKKGIKERTMVILRMGIFAISSLDSVPAYTAVNESVKLAKKVSMGSDKFVNAILRKYIGEGKHIEISDDDLSTKYSFSKEIVELISSQYDDEAEEILQALNMYPKTTLRVNLIKNSRNELIDELKTVGIAAIPDANTESGVICEGGDIVSSDAFKNGKFSIQGLSSIQAIEKFKPSANSDVLDMCAAPGGKTFAMAELMNNTGKIVACDVHKHKLDVMDAASKRLGITNVETILLDGTDYNKRFAEKFDYVLADVPCSGLGVVSTKPEIKFKSIEDGWDSLIETQKNILENAIKYTKNGGFIEYSTCTINKNENEAVVDAIIKSQNNVQILEKCLILPYNNLTGFFYCIMKKC